MSNAARIATPGAGDGGKAPVYDAGTDSFPLVDVATQAELGAAMSAHEATTTAHAEHIRDVIAGALVAGTNVTITPNDGADTITIAAAAAGGGAAVLDDLTDVTITAGAAGDILRHNGTAWVDAVGTTHFEAAGAVAAHEADTTSVHGIADTAALVTTSTALGGDLSGTVGNAQIAAGAVGTTELADGAVTAAKVAADVATQAELDAHTGSSTAHGISAFSATLLPQLSAAAARTVLGLGDMAVQQPSAVAITGGTVAASTLTGTIAEARLPATVATDTEVSAAVSAHAGVTSGVHGITAAAAALLDDADVATMRRTLRSPARSFAASGSWQLPFPAASSVAISQNRLYAVPAVVPVGASTLDGVAVSVVGAGVGTAMVIAWGVWAVTADGVPGALISAPGTTLDPTSTGVKSLTGAAINCAGHEVVWVGIVGQASTWTTAPTLARGVSSNFTPPVLFAAGSATDALSSGLPGVTGVSGAMPDPFGTPVWTSVNIPSPALRWI